MKDCVLLPIVIDGRELHKAHQEHEAEVRAQFLYCHLLPGSKAFPHAFLCVPVGLVHYVLQEGGGVEEENLHNPWNKDGRGWSLLKWLDVDRSE